MTAASPAPLPGPRIDVSWLVRLRWALTATQVVFVFFVNPLRGSHLHLREAVIFVALGALSNLAFMLWLRRRGDVRESTLGLVIAFDVALLTAVLVQGGGYSSPLSFLFLVEVAIAAVTLGRTWSWAIVALAVACSFGLLFHHSGHSHAPKTAAEIDVADREHALLHVEGMWIAFAVIGYFVARVKRALAARDAEFVAQRAMAARTEKLASLATLAAGAAHELATPLGTIAIAAKELERALGAPAGSADGAAADARLVREQVERCRQILGRMAGDAGASAADASKRMRIEELFHQSLEGLAWRERIRVEVDPSARAASFEAPPLALAQALRSALRNAVEASPESADVVLRAAIDGDSIRIEIADGGSGMPPEVLARAGEPFFTTKEPGRGMGLGLFLTRTVIERLGGSLRFDSSPARGTTAVLMLPARPPAAGAATNHRTVSGRPAG